MMRLIKLELRKVEIGKYIKGILIITKVIVAILILTLLVAQYNKDFTFTSYSRIMNLAESIVNGIFVIFAGVLIGDIIIGEYTDNTISVLFQYPVSRKKLMIAKLILVTSLTFLAILIGISIIVLDLYILEKIYPITQEHMSLTMIKEVLYDTLFSATTTSFIALIPLYIGMRKKTVSATMVTSIIVTSILNSNSNGFSLASIRIIPIILAVLGIALAYKAVIEDIETTDI
ncbi:ABC transporter permease [Clostridiaceae bacterium M8S5]|nr:ABC transporter permease [Clostridiaceae bacterium M8S5]